MNACQGNRPGFALQEAKSLRVSLLDNRTRVASTTPFTSGIRRDPGRRAGIRCEGGFAMLVSIVCVQCGCTFWANSYRARHGAKYCSHACLYKARHETSPATVEQRFWSKVSKSDSCWLWTGPLNGDGRAQFGINQKKFTAARLAWGFVNGPIPSGYYICHHCDDPRCVRPDHLFLGTAADNSADMCAKGRSPKGYTRHLRADPTVLVRGEANPAAKLSEDNVRAIRARFVRYKVTGPMLASEYGVSVSDIWQILTRKKWRHVL